MHAKENIFNNRKLDWGIIVVCFLTYNFLILPVYQCAIITLPPISALYDWPLWKNNWTLIFAICKICTCVCLLYHNISLLFLLFNPKEKFSYACRIRFVKIIAIPTKIRLNSETSKLTSKKSKKIYKYDI